MNKDRTVLSSADNRLSMLAMLQELPGKGNDFTPIEFSEGTSEEDEYFLNSPFICTTP
jgi:hypothetical protein